MRRINSGKLLHRFRFLSSPLSRHENRHAAADPYYRPGDKELAEAVRAVAHKHHAVLLANHGPVVAGSSLSAAGAAVEELEETARLHPLLHGHPTRFLTPEQITELREALPS